MKKYIFALTLMAYAAIPLAASAHQHATYTIGTSTYNFVVGSLNEPLVVDDKSGVDLTVTKGGSMTMSADGDMDNASALVPVSGLDTSLKVEIAAGGQKKTFDLSPVYGKPGSYSAPFYPTVATTLSYRFFGTIEGNAVNVTFTCLAAGSTKAADDTVPHKLSDTVTQTLLAGGFGCPLMKEDMGFPEKSVTIAALAAKTAAAQNYALAALALSVLAVGALLSRRSRS